MCGVEVVNVSAVRNKREKKKNRSLVVNSGQF